MSGSFASKNVYRAIKTSGLFPELNGAMRWATVPPCGRYFLNEHDNQGDDTQEESKNSRNLQISQYQSSKHNAGTNHRVGTSFFSHFIVVVKYLDSHKFTFNILGTISDQVTCLATFIQ